MPLWWNLFNNCITVQILYFFTINFQMWFVLFLSMIYIHLNIILFNLAAIISSQNTTYSSSYKHSYLANSNSRLGWQVSRSLRTDCGAKFISSDIFIENLRWEKCGVCKPRQKVPGVRDILCCVTFSLFYLISLLVQVT